MQLPTPAESSGGASKSDESSMHALNYKEALYLATMGGARSLGLGDQIGSLEQGKAFDALLVDVGVEQSQIDLVDEDGLSELLQKFLHLGDDRNITGVWVQGRRTKG